MQHTTESHCKIGSHTGGGNSDCTPHTSYQCRNAIFLLQLNKSQQRRQCFKRLPGGLSWQVKNISTCQRAGPYKGDLSVLACLFDEYLEMAVVQMMYAHVTLLCPPPQQQVWALLGGGSCRAIWSSPSPRRQSRWLSKIILSMEMLYGCRSRIEHA